MTRDERPTYTLTVRQSDQDAGRFEYVISRRSFQAVRAERSYATYDEAKAAGTKRGSELEARPSSTSADR